MRSRVREPLVEGQQAIDIVTAQPDRGAGAHEQGRYRPTASPFLGVVIELVVDPRQRTVADIELNRRELARTEVRQLAEWHDRQQREVKEIAVHAIGRVAPRGRPDEIEALRQVV